MLIYLRICHLKRRLRYETDSLQLIWCEISISRILKEANKYSSDTTKRICWNACIACKHWQFKNLCSLMQMNVKCSILRLRLIIYSGEIVSGVQFHFEKASIFSVHTKRRNLKISQLSAVIWICVSGKFGQWNGIIIVTISFPESSVLKMFSVRTKRQSQLFQTSPVGRAFSESSVFVTY